MTHNQQEGAIPGESFTLGDILIWRKLYFVVSELALWNYLPIPVAAHSIKFIRHDISEAVGKILSYNVLMWHFIG